MSLLNPQPGASFLLPKYPDFICTLSPIPSIWICAVLKYLLKIHLDFILLYVFISTEICDKVVVQPVVDMEYSTCSAAA